ncbi:MAG: prepilin peptidase [Pseudomonadota bacterium]|nr:prepilin peptidase [Pseudomonadota bacterium]
MEYVQYGLVIGLAIALIFAAISDIRHRIIANWLNAVIALGAPVFWWASGMSLWPDVFIQLGLAVVVFAAFAAMFAIGLLGGGDVKLLTALALWLTPLAFLDMLLVMAVMGGLIAIGFVIRRVVFKPKEPGRLPYGVAITVGGLWVLAGLYWPAVSAAAGAA